MYVDMDTILRICGGIIAVAGAIGAIWKWVLPAVKLSDRMKRLEHKNKEQDEAITGLVKSNGLMLQGMVYLIRHARTGNSVDDLGKMEKDILEYMAGGN